MEVTVELADSFRAPDNEVKELERKVTLPEEFRHRKQKLEKLQRTLSEPAKTETDVQQIQQEVRMLQREIQRLNDSISEAQRAGMMVWPCLGSKALWLLKN